MNKKNIRPNIASAKVNDAMSDIEQFQNGVLRPILKMQHNTIAALFDCYLKQTHFNMHALDKFQKDNFLKTTLSRNQQLKHQYIGIVLGMLTDDEFEHYLANASEHKRRIIQMTTQRLQDTYQ